MLYHWGKQKPVKTAPKAFHFDGHPKETFRNDSIIYRS